MRRWLPAFALAGLLATSTPTAQAPSVEWESLMTTPVILVNGNHGVSQGTGFFYATLKPDGQSIRTVFLVTNYHVVTGHEPGTPGRDGNRVDVVFHLNKDDPSNVRHAQIPLYSAANEPLWVSSSDFPDADVVLVPVAPSIYAGTNLIVFSEGHTLGDIRIRPTTEATLIGYPYGFYDTKNSLPVWKTGHLASEPDIDFEGQPVFLVDISAFPGMSGSPLLAVANGVYENLRGEMGTGHVIRLLGIFSGMRMVREKKANPSGYALDPPIVTDTPLQLGYVWKAKLIVDIARAYDSKSSQ